MKKIFGFLILSLFALTLSGCASACKKGCNTANAEYSPVVVAEPVVQAAAPAAPVAPAEESIPAATRRYVSK